MALDNLKGLELGSQTVVVEAAPVPVFATAIGEDGDDFRGERAPVPPTYPFSWTYWGRRDGDVQGLPIGDLRQRGMILHGEQEFSYARWPRVGDVLVGTRVVSDVYEKQTSSARMEFYVMETSWADAETGETVVTDRFTLIVRAKLDT
jgi:hypothetical protein